MPDNDNVTNSGVRLCETCGEPLDEDAKFCMRCGAAAPVPSERKKLCGTCGTELNDSAKFCKSCGAAVLPSEPEQAKYCSGCGEPLNDGAKFCRKCGTPAGAIGPDVFGSAPVQGGAGGAAVDSVTAKKRNIAAILYLVGACLSAILGLIFLCTPFMTVTIETSYTVMPSVGSTRTSVSQNGLTLIGVMFGGSSDLVEAGVNADLLRWAGWLTFGFIIAIIDHIVCISLNVSRYRKGERPYNVVQSNVAMLIASLGLLIVGCIARGQVSDWYDTQVAALGSLIIEYGINISLSTYLGFVGVFVMSILGTGCAVTAYAYSNRAFPPREKKAKKTGNVLKIFITDIVCAVAICVAAVAPVIGMMGYNYAKEISVSVGDSGKAGLVCDDTYGGANVGATVFKLEDMTYGGNYVFRIDTTDVGEYALVGCLVLVPYEKVKGLDASEIIGNLEKIYLTINTEDGVGTGYAELYFTNSYSYDELAVVVGFQARGEMKVNYKYSFKQVNR
ncbi:MAG: zinc ribbon domain-containing protein [Clostridiales bacterium]|nr:zinc ribbon domain-containing protein [Clostridiales bacterium]